MNTLDKGVEGGESRANVVVVGAGADQEDETSAMKIATYRVGGERRVGIVDERRQTLAPFDIPESEAALGVLALIDRPSLPSVLSPMPLREGTLEAPIPRPRRNIFCVGKNYHEHAHEFAASGFDSSAASGAVPKHPIIFSKVPDCVIAHRDLVSIDRRVSEAIDYEAELGVIIGEGGRGIVAANALDHVWGYTIINDVTARDLQGLYSQWLIGKSQDTFCPMGPWAVTRDEIDLKDTKIQCWINGELQAERQYEGPDFRRTGDHRDDFCWRQVDSR